MMLVSRFLLAIGSPGIYDISYILVIELISPEWRGMAGNAFGIPYAVGYSSLAGVAYYVRDWRNLQLVLTIPPLIFLCIMIFFIPESPRWCLSKGKVTQAEVIFRQIAQGNGKTRELPGNFSHIISQLSLSSKVRIFQGFLLISSEQLCVKIRVFSINKQVWKVIIHLFFVEN